MKYVSNMEKHDVVPSTVVEVCCTKTKKGNKKGLCTFYFCSRPTQLLGNILRRMFLDNRFQNSFDFSSLSNMLVAAVGFDKSDSDFVGTWKSCNRRKGNLTIYVQTFACLEGPVCENYENEKITIANKEYPIQQTTIQALVDDHLYALVVKVCDGSTLVKCECYVFSTTPLPPAGTNRQLLETALPTDVTDSMAFTSQN